MKDIFYLDVEQHTSSITPLSMFIDLSSSSSEKDLPSLVQNLGAWLNYYLFAPLEVVFFFSWHRNPPPQSGQYS